MTTRGPEDVFTFLGSATYESFEGYSVQGTVSGPFMESGGAGYRLFR